MSIAEVDLALVRKYNVAGPRYTSYPPATQFTQDITWDAIAPRMEAANRPDRPLSLYFHIPFCETLCWFCGCTTVITLNHEKGRDYIGTLEREIETLAPHIHPERKAVQLHFGGGSPTFLRPDEIRRLGEIIHRHFALAEEVEAGVEIDPRRLTRDHVAALREIGFNRASMGVQDFDPKVQEAIHRIQPRETTRQAMDWLREFGFGSTNIDLVYGLPSQTAESFDRTLDAVLEMAPERLAVFSYAHVPWLKPAQKIVESRVLPTPETKLQILKLVIEKLTADDRYVYIGMDHFARPDDELATAQRNRQLQRNFQGYSTRAGSDIIGFGMSAISQIPDAYWQNEKELPNYIAAVEHGRPPVLRGYVLTSDDQLRRETISRVMCDMALDFEALSRQFEIAFETRFARELESLAPFEADGLLKRTAEGIEVTGAGRLFIRNIAMCFDPKLAPAGERRHSKTI